MRVCSLPAASSRLREVISELFLEMWAGMSNVMESRRRWRRSRGCKTPRGGGPAPESQGSKSSASAPAPQSDRKRGKR